LYSYEVSVSDGVAGYTTLFNVILFESTVMDNVKPVYSVLALD